MTQNKNNASSPENINLAKVTIRHKEKWIPKESLFKKLDTMFKGNPCQLVKQLPL